MIYLPGHKGFTLESGEGAEACDEAQPAYFHQGDAVEQNAVGQDERDVGPAHTGPHGQQPVDQVHQGPVLWRDMEGASPHCQGTAEEVPSTHALIPNIKI